MALEAQRRRHPPRSRASARIAALEQNVTALPMVEEDSSVTAAEGHVAMALKAKESLSASPPPPPLPTEEQRRQLRSMWQLASVLNFLHVFRPVVEINVKFSAEDLENALITPNATLADIHIPLLKVFASAWDSDLEAYGFGTIRVISVIWTCSGRTICEREFSLVFSIVGRVVLHLTVSWPSSPEEELFSFVLVKHLGKCFEAVEQPHLKRTGVAMGPKTKATNARGGHGYRHIARAEERRPREVSKVQHRIVAKRSRILRPPFSQLAHSELRKGKTPPRQEASARKDRYQQLNHQEAKRGERDHRGDGPRESDVEQKNPSEASVGWKP
eukprot:Gb_41656 [translate_table: standard]